MCVAKIHLMSADSCSRSRMKSPETITTRTFDTRLAFLVHTFQKAQRGTASPNSNTGPLFSNVHEKKKFHRTDIYKFHNTSPLRFNGHNYNDFENKFIAKRSSCNFQFVL
jgi:hypothetical protein